MTSSNAKKKKRKENTPGTYLNLPLAFWNGRTGHPVTQDRETRCGASDEMIPVNELVTAFKTKLGHSLGPT